MTPEQRLAARKFNEQTKITATYLNAAAVALLGAAFIIPAVSNPTALLSWQPWLLLLGSIALHLISRMSLRLLRSEE